MLNARLKKTSLVLVAINLFAMSSLACAAPTTVFIHMDNQLKRNIDFIFKFKQESTNHSILFPPGKSQTSVPIQDNSVLSAEIAAEFTDNIQPYPCTITTIGSYQPHNLTVLIGSNYSCQISLS